ncbi:hypothetical protein [Pinibacter soli]|uniref:Energy transducer TonB n=1 Tax=Pinibacter soli TaxID=3044211 RepID=A0ABT6RAZ9_9BACT|nr:hypothetical protein [Pinibacter soli]MDI3319590.1 hypothetical protein [Pinibacter soli]
MMNDNFEQQKNIKAGSYTALIMALLLIAFITIKWTLPVTPPPISEDGIEVNLGNSDTGLGEDQPMSPESPAPAEKTSYTPPKASVAEEAVKEVETDDKAEEDAPVIKKPVVAKPEAKKIAEKEVAPKAVAKPTAQVPNPPPAPPKPKAVMHGAAGTGKGGNEADDYKKGGSQGIAGGVGDQGKPGGNPNSDSYTGNGGHGTSGVSISRGLEGRRITKWPSFEDDFNENAKVAINIRVDASGNVTSAVYEPKGSTTASSTLKTIAIRKAQQMKLSASDDEQIGTIIFNFRLKN